MRDNFQKALSLALVHEGGWSNNPNDPGGATMKGITQRVYNAYRRRNGLPERTVRSITDGELRAIYRNQYWNRIAGDLLPVGIDYCVFDAAVNSGAARGAKWLQQAAGVAPDGIVGERTIEAVMAKSPEGLINAVCDRRYSFVRGLRTWRYFGKGWSRRIADVRKYASAMAADASVMPAPFGAEMAKADGADRKLAAMISEGGKAEAATLTGGIGAGLSDMASTLLPFSDYSDIIKWLFVALLVAGAVFSIWKMVQRYRRGELA